MKRPSLKQALLVLALAGLGAYSSLAVADWVAKDANGANVTFDAMVNGVKIIPKFVMVDPTGVAVGTNTNPVSVSLSSASPPLINSAQSGAWTVSANQSGAWTVSPSGTWTISQGAGPWAMAQSGAWTVGQSGAWLLGLSAGSNTIGSVGQAGAPWGANLTQVNGSTLSLANPVPAQLSLNNGVGDGSVSGSNPLPVTCISGCFPSGAALATYAVGASWATPGTPTELAVLQGSDTKTIKVRRVLLTATAASATNVQVDMIRRSTTNTGGTLNSVTPAKLDTVDPAPTALFNYYTANPSGLGTSLGTLRTVTFGAVSSTSASITPSQEYTFGELNSKPLVLRGSGDFLAFNSAQGASYNMRLSVEWTEE
jgi:hypothetical protein